MLEGKCYLYPPLKVSFRAATFYAHEASTAKLLVTPSHGSPNVFIETPMLQLFAPMQACKRSYLLVYKASSIYHK